MSWDWVDFNSNKVLSTFSFCCRSNAFAFCFCLLFHKKQTKNDITDLEQARQQLLNDYVSKEQELNKVRNKVKILRKEKQTIQN